MSNCDIILLIPCLEEILSNVSSSIFISSFALVQCNEVHLYIYIQTLLNKLAQAEDEVVKLKYDRVLSVAREKKMKVFDSSNTDFCFYWRWRFDDGSSVL